MDDITKAMKEQEEVKHSDVLKSALDKFDAKMKTIMAKWLDVMRVMKSVKKLSIQEINKYEATVDDMRKLIEYLIETDPPLAGAKNPLTYPTTRKAHITFGKCAIRFLRDWHTFGDVAEENKESVHAVFNQLKRRFCGCKGKRQKKLIVRQYLFSEQSSYVRVLRKQRNRRAQRIQLRRSPQRKVQV